MYIECRVPFLIYVTSYTNDFTLSSGSSADDFYSGICTIYFCYAQGVWLWIFTWFRLSSDGNSEENPPKTHSSQLRCKRINLTTSLSHDLAFLISCVVYYRNYQIAMQTAQLVILFSVSLPLQLALICNLFIH